MKSTTHALIIAVIIFIKTNALLLKASTRHTQVISKAPRKVDIQPTPFCYENADSSLSQKNIYDWEGDDVRWSSKAARRLRRSIQFGTIRRAPVQVSLVLLNTAVFLYQCIITIAWIRKRHPEYWPSQALSIIFDVIIGSSIPGPLTRDFAHSAVFSRSQPHRYLTAGFLHGGLIHILLNMDALRRLPSWLETGLGSSLYLTTFLVAIVTGNLGHTFATIGMNERSFCIGSSGGICGLYGLMYTALLRMGNSGAATRVIKGMGMLIIFGTLTSSVSNAAHIGGFLGGILMGILFGPGYRDSYSARRKWSLEVDDAPRDYRQAMGFGRKPTQRGLIPLPLFWIFTISILFINPQYQSIPRMILRGIRQPGSLSSL